MKTILVSTWFVLFSSTLVMAEVADKTPSPMPSQAEGQGPGPGHRPPPEALAACESLKKDAVCNFTDKKGDKVTGTCASPDASKPLACRPARGTNPMHSHQ